MYAFSHFTIGAALLGGLGIFGAPLLAHSQHTDDHSLPFETLVEGQYAGIELLSGQVESYRITNETEWSTMWQGLTSNVTSPPERPEVNFAESMVLGVLGSFNTGGYSLTIQKVTELADQIKVDVLET